MVRSLNMGAGGLSESGRENSYFNFIFVIPCLFFLSGGGKRLQGPGFWDTEGDRVNKGEGRGKEEMLVEKSIYIQWDRIVPPGLCLLRYSSDLKP